jgi:AAA family ATP:ADP antiporter
MNIQGVTSDTGVATAPESQGSVLEGIEKVLERGSEEQIHYMLKKIRELNREELYTRVPPLLDHASAAVRADAIETLCFFQSSPMVEEIKPYIHDPDFEVKRAAFEYLFDRDTGSSTDLLETYLDDADREIADAALFSLAIETRNNETLKDRYNLKSRIVSRIETMKANPDPESRKSEKLRLSELLGFANIHSLNHHIMELFYDRDTEVVRKAIQSAAHTFDPLFINPLVDFLGNEPLKEAAQNSLASYGVPLVSKLMETLEQRTASIESLRNIPGILERIDSQLAVNALFQLLDDPDYQLRQKATRSLNKAKVKYPHLDFHKKEVAQRILEEGKLYLNTLSVMHAQIIKAYKKGDSSRGLKGEIREQKRKDLIDLLEKRLDRDLQRIFGLLGLKYPPGDIHQAYEGIQSDKPEQRINAIEYLDNLLEPDLKRVLIPIVETTVLDDFSEESLRSLSMDIPSEKECFEMLLAGYDRRIKLTVLNLIEQLDEEKYIPVVRTHTDGTDDDIQAEAKRVLSNLINN